jgi:alpha-tubulin suppressor-like RCC1 family protein
VDPERIKLDPKVKVIKIQAGVAHSSAITENF